MDRDQLRDLVEASDLNGLVRFIDRVVEARDWDGLIAIRDGCVEAVERGKQVWGAAQFAEYRMALDAPGVIAASVIVPGAGRFALGPLWEVAASTHSWDELEPHVLDPAPRAFTAHERAIRGDEGVREATIDPRIVEVPLRLEPWEPTYPVAVYRSDRADFPERETPSLDWVELPEAAPAAIPDPACDAMLELVRPWIDDSSGRGEAVAAAGSAFEAIRTLGPRRVRAAQVTFADALGVMVWTGASGGAYGKRRGTPAGRAAAWWAVASLLGLDDDWPPDPADLGADAASLDWWVWDPGDRVGGWNFHLAVEDPEEGLAWAVTAADWK